jgi:D-erythrulose 1-phosphate 3-epimerase
MTHKLHIDIGINGAFITRRWEEPENWMRLTAELGYPWQEFCGDVIDPFFSGDRSFQMTEAAAVKEAADRYKVRITDIYTGMATHRFHGLSHRNESVRARMRDWIIECMDIALAMGATRIGGHWDAFSVETLADPKRFAEAKACTYQQFRDLAVIAKIKGMDAIYNEQMYIPSEIPWTIDGTYEFLEAVNKDRAGVPIYITVDVGHMAGMHYGLKGDELDYRVWLRHFAPVSEIIHIQQTAPEGSSHMTFSEENNKKGHISIEETLAAIKQGHQEWAKNPLSKILPPVSRSILISEIIPGSTKHEDTLLNELKANAAYLRRFIPEGGLNWTF